MFNGLEKKLFPLLGRPIHLFNLVELDLSVNNPDESFRFIKNQEDLNTYIKDRLPNHNDIGIGGYLEQRNLYSSFSHFNGIEDSRNLHLGIDIWTKAYTTIYAPYEGKAVVINNIQLDGDYGGLLIIQHKIDDFLFHTLYGHLSPDSIAHFVEGDTIANGQALGELGAMHENGNWPPHLHFQIIIDLTTGCKDYPGVCARNDLEYYMHNCPDPRPFIV